MANAAESVRQSVIAMMRERGIDNPEHLLTFASQDRIIAACRWWDTRHGAGAGVLAKAIRKGGMDPAPPRKRSVVDQQRGYGEGIADWLRENFPEYDRPRWGPHPAATAAVIRLDHRHGKDRRSKREYAPEIRAAVRAWEAEEAADSEDRDVRHHSIEQEERVS